jgi:sec-independent protein translocase protein TatA
MLGPQELILIFLIVFVIFGAKRIPEIMGEVGKGIKSFKKAMDGEDSAHAPAPPPIAEQDRPRQGALEAQPTLSDSQPLRAEQGQTSHGASTVEEDTVGKAT